MTSIRQLTGLLAAFASLVLAAPAAAEPALAGDWHVTAEFQGGRSAATMTLGVEGRTVSGSSGPLDEAGFFELTVRGEALEEDARLELRSGDDLVGALTVATTEEGWRGAGTLFGTPVTVAAVRPPKPGGRPVVHDFRPDSWTIHYSARTPPVLRIRPGDTVRTSLLDNQGRDADLRWRAMPGNTLTGPFHVEGAMPGDTLVVHIERVALNRDTADMYSGAINGRAVQGGYAQQPTPGWGRGWVLDRTRGVARLAAPGQRLGGLELPLRPMIGSIGVAPPLNQALFAGDLGFHGGNLDYDRVTGGATVYLPVWQAGAQLALGDAHALQGDGEITGQGLETSLDVTFRVELIRGRSLRQVWMEDAEYVMVSGVDNGLDASLAMATTGMARWLKENYALADSEIAALMGAAVEYDIAEVVDPRPHVVARLPKRVLAMIPRAD